MSRHFALLALLAALTACRKDEADGKLGAADAGGGADGGADEPEPLAFDLREPFDGAYTDLASMPVSGSVSGGVNAVVTVNGAPADVADGAWTVPAARADLPWPDSPLYPLLGEATDDNGDWVRDRVTLAYGDSANASEPVPGAIAARLTDHALDTLDPAIQDLVAGLDLSSLLVGSDPVAEILGGQVYVTAASFGGLAVDLDFEDQGLAYTLIATDVTAELTIDFGWFDTGGDLAVEEIDVSGHILLGASAGELTLTPIDTAVAIAGLEAFGFNDPTGIIDGLLNTFLADTLAGLLEEQVVSLADSLLSVLDSITNLEFSGLVLNTRFTGASHDEAGVTLFAETAVSVPAGTMPAKRFSNPNASPAISGMTTSGGDPYAVALYLDDDLLSALGAGLVGSGLLEQEITGDLGALTLDTTLLGGVIPGFDTLPAGEPVTLRTRADLPPIGTAGSGVPEAGRLHIGGLLADFAVQDEVVMTVALDTIVGVGLGEEVLLDISVVDAKATLLSTTLGSTPAEVEPGLGTLINLAVPLLVGDLLGSSLDLSALPVELIPLESGPAGDRAAIYLDLGDLSGLDLGL